MVYFVIILLPFSQKTYASLKFILIDSDLGVWPVY